MDNSSAFPLPYFVVGVVAVLLFLGGMAFFIVALVKAFTKKTKGWIITAVLMGLLGIAGLAAGIVGAAYGIAKQVEESSKLTKVVASKSASHSLTVPGSWKVMPELNNVADIATGNVYAEQYAIALVELKEDVGMSLPAYLEVSTKRIMDNMTQGSQDSASELIISGHRALQRRLSGTIEGQRVVYLQTCVETPEHLAHILCWTLATRETSALPMLKKVTATFTEAGSSASGVPGTKADPATRLPLLIKEQFGVEPSKVNLDSRLKEDLGADQLDEVELIMAVEEEFNLSVSDEEAEKWKTVGDIVRWVEAARKSGK